VELPWGPGGGVRASAGPPMRHHCIGGSRFAPKGGCISSTCEDLV
jgi:hypothetical protein